MWSAVRAATRAVEETREYTGWNTNEIAGGQTAPKKPAVAQVQSYVKSEMSHMGREIMPKVTRLVMTAIRQE